MSAHRLTLLFVAWFASVACGQSTWPEIQRLAGERFGEAGSRAAAFLAEHRPGRDDAIDPEIVLEAMGVSLAAREKYAWAKAVPDELFLNDVLAYAVLDEERVRARARVHELASDIVREAKSAEEAVQAINRELFARTGVKYSTQRRRANQNVIETLETKMASCTGLSILLVEACRSVGIPARLAGIANWTGRGGNHAWVEVHDGERWRFTGAAEYDAAGLDRAWFTGQAGESVTGHLLHGVWATSYRTTGKHFPLVWSLGDRSVPGVDVTERYARRSEVDASPKLALRLWESRGGARVASKALMPGRGLASETFSDPVDVNRVAEFEDDGVRPTKVTFSAGEETRHLVVEESMQPGRVIDVYWDELGLSKANAEATAARLWKDYAESVREERAAELDAMVVRAGEHEMKLLRKDFGEAPASGPSLWISMHGGGGAPAEVNDQQWQNQIRLYKPDEGIVIAPRAPSNTWNLWHRGEIDVLFDRLISSAVIAWGVDPNRVYLMGYSAGGDGVYQLAPRLADRFAAASMMAGHPNDASPLGLRNLPFAIFMGGKDSAYNRNTVAAEWGERLKALREADPTGYEHRVTIYPEDGHWMGGKDAEALPWMAGFTREPWPKKVVWEQGHTAHERFSWLVVEAGLIQRGQTMVAEVSGQSIRIESVDVPRVEVLLSDALLDLDEPVTVVFNGRTLFEGRVMRNEGAMIRSLSLRADPAMMATASVTVWPSEAEE